MFYYFVHFTDTLYGDSCNAHGRVSANSENEAVVRVKEFYSNIEHIVVTPIDCTENSIHYEGEWDI